MSRKNPHADRNLRLTKTDGQPITVNFNFVALREEADVFPDVWFDLIDVTMGNSVVLEMNYGGDPGRIGVTHIGNRSSRLFNVNALGGAVLTLAGETHREPVEVLQSPAQIARALSHGVHDLHPAGHRRFERYADTAKTGLQEIILQLRS